jgi:RNA polymerase primary sigma factor
MVVEIDYDVHKLDSYMWYPKDSLRRRGIPVDAIDNVIRRINWKGDIEYLGASIQGIKDVDIKVNVFRLAKPLHLSYKEILSTLDGSIDGSGLVSTKDLDKIVHLTEKRLYITREKKQKEKSSDIFRFYLNTIKRYPILKKEDEQAIFKELDKRWKVLYCELRNHVAYVTSLRKVFKIKNRLVDFKDLSVSSLTYTDNAKRKKVQEILKKISNKERGLQELVSTGRKDERREERLRAGILMYVKRIDFLDYNTVHRIIEDLKGAYHGMKKESPKEVRRLESEYKTTRDNMKKLIKKIEAHEKNIKETEKYIIYSNQKLVMSMAGKFLKKSTFFEFMDLIQEGNIGLIKGMRKFEYKRGYKFSTYVNWWIRQALSRAMSNQSRVLRLPVHLHEKGNKIYRTTLKLVEELGREPTIEEIADGVRMNKEVVGRIQYFYNQRIVSLFQKIGEDGSELGDFIEDTSAESPRDPSIYALVAEELDKMLSKLDKRQEKVLKMRSGLYDGRIWTLEEIGRQFHCSREMIRQIQDKALKKLRHPTRIRKLEEIKTLLSMNYKKDPFFNRR